MQKQKQKEEENKGKLVEKQKIIEVTNKQITSKNYQLNSTILTLHSINELVEELINKRETDELMETALPSIMSLIKGQKGFIAEFEPEANIFRVLTSCNTKSIFPKMEIARTKDLCLKKLQEAKNLINIFDPGNLGEEEFKNAIIFPLIIEKELKGVLFIMDKEESKNAEESYFLEEDEATVKTLGKLVSAIWESIHLFELASVDNLSRLYVRRFMEKSLDEEIRKAMRNHNSLSLIVIDIDNLQNCNDQYGHTTGDQVIKMVAEKVKEYIEKEDMAARYGGEKLIVFMPEKTSDEASYVADELREAIESMEISLNNSDIFHITVSMGISCFPENGTNSEELIKTADEALYRAKREGKNQVSIAGAE